MRTAALMIAAATALSLSACNPPADETTSASPEALTEAAEAAGVAVVESKITEPDPSLNPPQSSASAQ